MSEELLVKKTQMLLKRAKKMYPVGTEYRPAHLISSTNQLNCIVMIDQVFYFCNNTIYLNNPNGKNWSKERNGHIVSQVLYDNGKWAEIINDYEGWE